MKGQDIIAHITKAKMPDREYIRENSKRGINKNTDIQKRKFWLNTAAVAACLVFALAITLTLVFNFGAETTGQATPNGFSILIRDENIDHADDPNLLTTSVSYIDTRPSLRFFITGENIAEIKITTENESINAIDWTKTLDEKFWNHELFYEEIELNGEIYKYIPADSGYSNSFIITFPEGFKEHDQIWYSWMPHNLYNWANEDSDKRFHDHNSMSRTEIEEKMETMSDEERLTIAAGGGRTSNIGHMILDGYPAELLNDRITISITDKEGHTTTTSITVSITTNSIGQTVITAKIDG